MTNTEVKAVVGLRRHGKSSHVVRMTQGSSRVIFYDTMGDDYAEGIVCRDPETLEKFWRGVYRGKFRISFKPPDPIGYFPRMCDLVWECQNLTFVVDEVHLYGGNWPCQRFTQIITGGGHRDIELIGVTQCPKKLGELLRSQATTWDVFRLLEGRHRDYILDRLPGIDPAQLQALERYEYLHYEDGADGYWRCKDDLRTGRMECKSLAYATQAPAPAPRADPVQHEDAGRSVGD